MRGDVLLSHGQLHEVLFKFLEDDDLFNCRLWHGAGAAILLEYAKMQLKDVLGYDGEPSSPAVPDIPTALVRLLVTTKGVMDPLVNDLRWRSLSTQQLIGPQKQKLAMFGVLLRMLEKCRGVDLHTVDLEGVNSVSEEVVRLIEQRCHHLATLHLGISDVLPSSSLQAIAQRAGPELRSLKLGGESARDDTVLMEFAENCPNLEGLQLKPSFMSYKTASGASMRLLSKRCQYFRTLSLDRGWESQASSEVELLAQKCPHLESLDITATAGYLSANAIKLFATHCCRLVAFRAFGSTNIDDEGLKLIAERNPNLTHLDLGFSRGVTDESMAAVARCCKNLECLHVANATGITDKGILLVAQCCPKLRTFNFNCNFNITDASLSQLVARCKELVSLQGTGVNGSVSDAAVRLIASHVPHLRELYLGDATVSDDALVLLASSCRQLETLVVRGSEDSYTDAFIDALTASKPPLRTLGLGGQHITDAAVARLVACCRYLEYFNVTGVNVGDSTVFALMEHCPRLTELTCSRTSVTDASIVPLVSKCHQLLYVVIPTEGGGITEASRKALEAAGCLC